MDKDWKAHRKKPTQSRSKVTFNAVLQATAQILGRDGIKGLSTNRIAERAGVSVGSLYQYFPNKESILATMVERYLKKRFQMVINELKKDQSKDLEKIVEAIIEVIVENKKSNSKVERILDFYFTRAGGIELMALQDDLIVNHIKETLAQAYPKIAPKIANGDLNMPLFVTAQAVKGVVVATNFVRPEYLGSSAFKKELTTLVTNYLGPIVQTSWN